jgi:hypothetical protein
MLAVFRVFFFFLLAEAILIGDPRQMQEFMIESAQNCKAAGIPCHQCKLRTEFIYNEENRESPDFVPLWNMVRWNSKFIHTCSAVLGSGL